MSFDAPDDSTASAPVRMALAVFCALLAVGFITYGYFKLRAGHAQQNTGPAKPAVTPVPPAKAKVYEDEPRLKGGQASITGTVENISQSPLTDLAVEVELIPRSSQKERERRVIALAPQALNPGQQGAYTLLADSDTFASVYVVAVKSGGQAVCEPKLQKCAADGKQRPRETIPDQLPAAKRAAPPPPPVPAKTRKPNSNDVINTPETADRY